MNKIKILFVPMFAALILFSLYVNGESRQRQDAWDFIEAPTTSGTVITGKCIVGAIYASSNSISSPSNYFFLVSTSGANSSLDTTMFSAADYRSPVVLFPVSTVTTAGHLPSYKVVDYGDDGVYISS